MIDACASGVASGVEAITTSDRKNKRLRRWAMTPADPAVSQYSVAPEPTEPNGRQTREIGLGAHACAVAATGSYRHAWDRLQLGIARHAEENGIGGDGASRRAAVPAQPSTMVSQPVPLAPGGHNASR